MYTLEEMEVRLQYLQSISPGGAAQMFAELKEALEKYLTRDEEFSLQVNKKLDKIIAFDFHSRIKYEHQELLEPWQEVSYSFDKPLGFDDVRELFVLDDVLEEIMTVSDMSFLQAFFTVQAEENSGGGERSNTTSELHNTYVDKWIAELTAGLANEIEGLKAIMRSCANRSYAAEWAQLFEELGKCTNRRKVRTFAKDIFYERGYGWLIETFHLDTVYRPSYIDDLPDWVDDSDTITTYTTTTTTTL